MSIFKKIYLLAATAAIVLSLGVTSMAQAATVAQGGTDASGTTFASSGSLVLSNNAAYFQGPTTPPSDWVWLQQDPGNNPVTFNFTFDLTGFQISTASLAGLWGIDNIGSVVLNGTTILSNLPLVEVGNFNVLTAFSSLTGFNAGLNTLAFNVANAGGPGAFRATAVVTASPVPVPAAGLLLIGALGGLVALRRRKARADV